MAQNKELWSVLRMLEWATEFFEQKQVKNPRLSIEWLLSDVLEVKRLDLYLLFDRPLSKEELDQIRPLIKRRANHEPLQYITGYTPFHNVEIDVNEHVLIPRMETEYLVEMILDDYKESDMLFVLDIGTGSGCIPIALKNEKENWSTAGFDVSEEAIQLALSNADKYEMELDLFQADLFEKVKEEVELPFWEVIVSNPPYILPSEKDTLDEEVVNHEPHLALFTENTNHMFSTLEEFARKNLVKGGKIYLEINSAEWEKVLAIFSSNFWKSEARKDYDNHHRYIVAELIH